MAVRGLGNLFDICHGSAPVADVEAGIQTGARLHMRNYGGVAIVGYFGAVSAGTDTLIFDVNEHDAATSGNTQELDVVTQVYIKFETTLDGDEQWTRVTQSAASEITLTGATYASTQVLAVAEVDAGDLSDGFQWISVIQADPGSGGTRPGCYFYIPYELKVMRRPDQLPQPNA